MIEVDGSMGEGGGQVLRTTIAVSAITGKPVRVKNIRAKRDNPGLRPQHLIAVKAIAALSGGKLVGAEIGSTTLEFYPGRIKGGSYFFDVGTAGSVSLVLQALLPVMAFAESPVEVKIVGGTDVPKAPTVDYMREVLSRLTSSMGFSFQIFLERRGHYPRGGGAVRVRVDSPPRAFKARDFVERGNLLRVAVRSHAVRLPRHVAERQAQTAKDLLRRELGAEPEVQLEHSEDALGPGSGVLAWAVFESTTIGADSLGAPGKRAERVGEEAARVLLEDLSTGACLDRHASDMVPLYAALSRGTSVITGAALTSHAETTLELLNLLLEGYSYELEGSSGRPFRAIIKGAGVG
ncbi:MAG: RNA 3'-terminal phosphate cyclase [Acidilobaceae archaeon]|nr:RNA 3'-terminal phosphate cyclase [Acidilobaceae archaeon]